MKYFIRFKLRNLTVAGLALIMAATSAVPFFAYPDQLMAADWELVCILRLAYMTLRRLTIAYAFRNPALSVTKCRYLQSLLRCVKSNALRLNKI